MRLRVDTTTAQIITVKNRRSYISPSFNCHFKVFSSLPKGIRIGDVPFVFNSNTGIETSLQIGFASSTIMTWHGMSWYYRTVSDWEIVPFILISLDLQSQFGESGSSQSGREATYIREETDGRSTLIFQVYETRDPGGREASTEAPKRDLGLTG